VQKIEDEDEDEFEDDFGMAKTLCPSPLICEICGICGLPLIFGFQA